MAIRVSVCGTFIKPTGIPARGSVRFTMRPLTVNNVTDLTITANSVVANLDASGHFEIDLQATDDPDITPSGDWTYLVEEDLYDGPPRQYDIDLPVALAGGPCVNLALLAPMAPSGGGSVPAGVSLETVLELLGLNGPFVEP